MKHKVIKGHLGRFWPDDDYKNLTYTRQPLMQSEIDSWVNKGYDYVKSFSGSMYDNKNPMPDWVERFKEVFSTQYKDLTFTFYKMQTLEIMPPHVDHFSTYCRLNNTTVENVVRILVMLEDWKPGHYLEIDGKAQTNWIAGDWFMWENDVEHAASNIGVEDRYSLQITATKITVGEVWHNLHWYNIPDMPTKSESTTGILKEIYKHTVGDENPMYVYMYNEQIKDLENIKHDVGTVMHLNGKGLHFYLYEPLCSYLAWNTKPLYEPYGTKHSRFFYSEFLGPFDYQHHRADELDSILKYMENNYLTNVTVHTCDYDVEKYFPHYMTRMLLKTDDVFVKTAVVHENPDGLLHRDFTKKFICLNWRYTPHRHLLAMYLAQLSGYVSWYYRADAKNVARGPWYDAFHWAENHPDYYSRFLKNLAYLNNNVPMNVDLDIKEAVSITHPYFIQSMPTTSTMIDHRIAENVEPAKIETFYKDVFCDIVTESRFAQPTGNYSEKVYQPMLYKKPFVLAAPPKTLQFLKEQGFKTFDEFWDESYDDELVHEERLFKIFNLIDEIDDKSIEELRTIYDKMAPILDHNYNLVMKILGKTP